MATQGLVVLSGVVEGLVDEAILQRLVQYVGTTLGAIYGKRGKNYLRDKLGGFNNAARFHPWVVLVDLDQDAECAPDLRTAWLPDPSPYMCFRVAVRMAEAWLLADRDMLSTFLSVRASRIPGVPEAEPDPKRTMVQLAAHSRRRDIREDMRPRPGSGRPISPAYSSRLIEFAREHWRPDVAATGSASLRRCIDRLRDLG